MNSYDELRNEGRNTGVEPIRCSRCGGELDENVTHDDFGPVCDTCSKTKTGAPTTEGIW